MSAPNDLSTLSHEDLLKRAEGMLKSLSRQSCWLVASTVGGKVTEVWLRGPSAPWNTGRMRGEHDMALYEVKRDTFHEAYVDMIDTLAHYLTCGHDPFADLRHLFHADVAERVAVAAADRASA